MKTFYTNIMLVILATSCGLLGPDYKQPKLIDNDSWTSDQCSITNSIDSLPQKAWWHKFHDNQLNSLIEKALAHNNNIEIAKYNLLLAQETLTQVEMNWVPTINLGGIASNAQLFNNTFHSQNPSLNGIQPDKSSTFQFSGVGVIPSYTLNVFSQLNQQKLAKLNIKLQEQYINSVKLAVISQVAASYFTLLGLYKQLALQKQTIIDAQAVNHYNLIKNQLGQADDLQVLSIKQFISQLQAQIPQIEYNITQVQNTIQVLTDHNPEQLKLVNNFDNINNNDIIPVNLPSTVLNNRPDIAIAEYQIQIANANIGLARSQFFPTISLTSPIGMTSSNLSKLFSSSSNFWNAQIAANIPLLNLGLTSEINKAHNKEKIAYYNYVLTVRTAFADTDNALNKHDDLQQIAKANTRTLAQAIAITNQLQIKYNYGQLGYGDIVNSKLNIDYIKANNNQTKIQQMDNIVKIYQALGGGYEAQ